MSLSNTPSARFVVALNIRCSKKWAIPVLPLRSTRDPTRDPGSDPRSGIRVFRKNNTGYQFTIACTNEFGINHKAPFRLGPDDLPGYEDLEFLLKKMVTTAEDDKVLYFKVSPNPFTSSTNIQFSLAQDTYVSVELYNYTGVKLKSIYNGDVSAGNDVTVRLSSVSSMQAGIYLLVLRTNQAIETRRIILSR